MTRPCADHIEGYRLYWTFSAVTPTADRPPTIQVYRSGSALPAGVTVLAVPYQEDAYGAGYGDVERYFTGGALPPGSAVYHWDQGRFGLAETSAEPGQAAEGYEPVDPTHLLGVLRRDITDANAQLAYDITAAASAIAALDPDKSSSDPGSVLDEDPLVAELRDGAPRANVVFTPEVAEVARRISALTSKYDQLDEEQIDAVGAITGAFGRYVAARFHNISLDAVAAAIARAKSSPTLGLGAVAHDLGAPDVELREPRVTLVVGGGQWYTDDSWMPHSDSVHAVVTDETQARALAVRRNLDTKIRVTATHHPHLTDNDVDLYHDVKRDVDQESHYEPSNYDLPLTDGKVTLEHGCVYIVWSKDVSGSYGESCETIHGVYPTLAQAQAALAGYEATYPDAMPLADAMTRAGEEWTDGAVASEWQASGHYVQGGTRCRMEYVGIDWDAADPDGDAPAIYRSFPIGAISAIPLYRPDEDTD